MLSKRSKTDSELDSEERIVVETLLFLDDSGSDEEFQRLADKVRDRNMKLWNAYREASS